MSVATGSAMAAREHPTFVEKAAAWSSWIFAGCVFSTIGWMAMAPDDPLGAVSLLTRRGAGLMLLQAAGLSVMTAALVTVVIGRRLPHAGTFAAGLGLAAASVRGGTTIEMLALGVDAAPDYQSTLAMQFAFEAGQWFAVLLAAAWTSSVVTRWCHGAAVPSRATPDPAGEYHRPNNTLQHFGITALGGFIVFLTLAQGWSGRSLEHGQACFMSWAAVSLAAYVAYRVAPVHTLGPSLLAVGGLAIAGYLWASFKAPSAGLPAIIPASPFLRVLPIQFVSVGFAAAVMMHWYMLHSPHESEPTAGDARD